MTDKEFDRILHQALCPEVAPEDTALRREKPEVRKNRKVGFFLKRAVLVAAVLVLLVTTVYAAKNTAEIAHLIANADREVCQSYRRMDRIMTKAGFRMDAPEDFSNGYGFTSAEAQNVHALDADRNLQFSFYQISVTYQNQAGNTLLLVAQACINGLSDQPGEPDETRRIGAVTAAYSVVHYKYVPKDYELTREDEKMLKNANYQIVYGANQVTETDFGYLSWEKDGVCYSIVDMGQNAEADTLFSMAEEVILGRNCT